MSRELKSHNNSDFEVDSQDLHLQFKLRTIRTVDGVRGGLTILALIAGIAVLGVSADALYVWDSTHVPSDFFLPLWPNDFDIRPTIALVAGGAVVVVSSLISLLFSKLKFVSVACRSFRDILIPAIGRWISFLHHLLHAWHPS
jgi:hypothetical protein